MYCTLESMNTVGYVTGSVVMSNDHTRSINSRICAVFRYLDTGSTPVSSCVDSRRFTRMTFCFVLNMEKTEVLIESEISDR